MEQRPLMNSGITEIEERSEAALSELRQVWFELQHRATPAANAVAGRIADFSRYVMAQVDPPADPRFGVYVIELDQKVLRTPTFMERNRQTFLPGRECLYVGHTEAAPEHRFLQHLQGEHAASIVKKFGLRLRPEFYEAIGLFQTRELAEAKEEELAELLRAEGYGVWYN